jgi:hypothetical protein
MNEDHHREELGRSGPPGPSDPAVVRARLAGLAREYSRMVTEWFRNGEQALRDKEREFLLQAGTGASRVQDDIAAITGTVRILRTHQHLIYDRLSSGLELAQQAGQGPQRQREAHSLIQEALEGIDRSITAWLALKESFPEQTDSILSLLVHLDRLRRATQKFESDRRKAEGGN